MDKILSKEEDACKFLYKENTCQDQESRRYIVRLPFKENVVDLGESYTIAQRQFYALERFLVKNTEIKAKYIVNIKTYAEIHHMTSEKSVYSKGYYPHHYAVIKKSTLATQLRAVYNGSAKMSTGFKS